MLVTLTFTPSKNVVSRKKGLLWTVSVGNAKIFIKCFLLKLIVKDSVNKFQFRDICISPINRIYNLLKFNKISNFKNDQKFPLPFLAIIFNFSPKKFLSVFLALL